MARKQLDSVLLSKGEFFKVYLIKDINKKILKILEIPKSLEKEKCFYLKQEFKKEQEILNFLNVKNIPKIISKSNTHILLDYIEGYSLKEYIKNVKLSIDEILEITYKLLKIVEEIHNQMIIHGDIKPSNIIYDGLDIYLIDFGAAQLKNEKNKCLQISKKYASPIIIKNSIKSYETDIYSIFIIILEMLTLKKKITEGKDIFENDRKLSLFFERGISYKKREKFKNIKEVIDEFKRLEVNFRNIKN